MTEDTQKPKKTPRKSTAVSSKRTVKSKARTPSKTKTAPAKASSKKTAERIQGTLELADNAKPTKGDVNAPVSDGAINYEIAPSPDEHAQITAEQDSTKDADKEEYPDEVQDFKAVDEGNDDGPKMSPLSPLGSLPKNRVDQGHIRYIYIGILIGWSIFIIILKGIYNLDVWFISITSAILIVGYGLFARYIYRDSPIRADRLGDNCYYLGLSFTLASLIATLLQLRGGYDGAALIGNFGVALISTAVGIIMRMVLMQFRVEIDDFETKARIQLAETSRTLTTAMNNATADFRSFEISSRQAITEAMDSIASRFERTSQSLELAVTSSLSAIEARTQAADAILERFESRFEALEKFTIGMSESAQALSKRMDDVDVRPEKLSKALENLTLGVERTAEILSASSDRLSESTMNTQRTEEALASVGGHIEKIDNALSHLTDTLEVQKEVSDIGLDSMKAHMEAVKEFVVDAKEEREGLRKASKEVFDTLGDLAKVVVKGVEGV